MYLAKLESGVPKFLFLITFIKVCLLYERNNIMSSSSIRKLYIFLMHMQLKPATHLAILYADRGECDRRRSLQTHLAILFRRSGRFGSFEKSCEKIAQPDFTGDLQ